MVEYVGPVNNMYVRILHKRYGLKQRSRVLNWPPLMKAVQVRVSM